MSVPTVTMNELSAGIEDANDDTVKKILMAILDDFMDLQVGKVTPYTTGKVILPNETTIEDIDKATLKTTDTKFKNIFVKISETFKSGDLTPQSKNGENGNRWDPRLHPVLVLVRPNNQ